jgi:hypothetical protein
MPIKAVLMRTNNSALTKFMRMRWIIEIPMRSVIIDREVHYYFSYYTINSFY